MTPKRKLIKAAVLGGVAGALAMDVVQYGWTRAFESARPSTEQDEETEAITAVVALLTRHAPRLFREADAATIGNAIHYGFGVAFAGAYFSLLPRRKPDVLRGLVFGTLLWLLSDRILIPAFKLGRPWSRYSVTERANALVSHLAYAVVVEVARPTR